MTNISPFRVLIFSTLCYPNPTGMSVPPPYSTLHPSLFYPTIPPPPPMTNNPREERSPRGSLTFMGTHIPSEVGEGLNEQEWKEFLGAVEMHGLSLMSTFKCLVTVDKYLAIIVSRRPEVGPFYASFQTALQDRYSKYAANQYYWISKDDTPLTLRGGVSIKDFALPWEGAGFSSTDVSGWSLAVRSRYPRISQPIHPSTVHCLPGCIRWRYPDAGGVRAFFLRRMHPPCHARSGASTYRATVPHVSHRLCPSVGRCFAHGGRIQQDADVHTGQGAAI